MANSQQGETWALSEDLVELTRADTAFADLYLQRARDLLSPELSETQWSGLGDLEAEVAGITSRIAGAMELGDWQQVHQLSGRLADLKRVSAERAPVRALAGRVYGFDEILVDPFSPGLCRLAGVAEAELPAFRDAALKRLERLRLADPKWGELYEARRRALAGLQLGGASVAVEDARPSVASLRARAQQALVTGDVARLQQLSTQLIEAEQAGGAPGAAAPAVGAPEGRALPQLSRELPRAVCDRGARLGLAAARVQSTLDQVRARFNPAWIPTPAENGGESTIRLSVSIPRDASEALRDAVALLSSRPFVTSAGTRYMPSFVAEDALVEDFDEPAPGVKLASPLLEALGLPGRTGLSRRRIERALRARGAAVVADLGLDPREYRLVCVPVDVYTRLGAERGWGQRELWTHFDGYMVSKERKLMAVAGGDVRFGGLQDLVAVGPEYDTDRLLARFAVVQRRRFETW